MDKTNYDYSLGLTPELKKELWKDMVNWRFDEEIEDINNNEELSNEEKKLYISEVEERRIKMYHEDDEDD